MPPLMILMKYSLRSLMIVGAGNMAFQPTLKAKPDLVIIDIEAGQIIAADRRCRRPCGAGEWGRNGPVH